MNDDYLWDGSGKPDPEVQRLERLLGGFRHNRPAPEFPAIAPKPKRVLMFPRLVRFAAAAAAVLLVAAGAWYGYLLTRPAWIVETVTGAPRVEANTIRETGKLRIGQLLETDAFSKARISVSAIGEVAVEPNTRLRLLEARSNEHRLALDRGKIEAKIWAPPRLFSVNTPSAVAIDLGCRYTLEVDETGAGFLHVTYGWVAFEQRGRESFVPAEAVCATRPGIGPGTPYFKDAPQALRRALDNLDFELGGVSSGGPGGVVGGVETVKKQRAEALKAVLREARPRDAFTLWHLLSRTEGDERGPVFDRLAKFVPPPKEVTREGIVAGNRAMLDAWWNELGLRDASWWRMWKGPVPAR